PGACKPDCSGVIETREIRTSSLLEDGHFGNNPVAYADSLCMPGYKAMFAYESMRRGTTTPWESVGAVDWPVQPYTHYVNSGGMTVWITDDIALLGVRDGAHVDFENPIFQGGCNPICFFKSWISGIKPDGTNLSGDNCNGWTDLSANSDASYGNFATGVMNAGTADCTFGDLITSTYNFACIQM
ncbi:MAG: DUF1554 domain-containing protein, partial [Myxococcales bacterium]|nr:DUF1554 domain-containing protein [Myxococcales bacterium]